jgi:hypothetical protein
MSILTTRITPINFARRRLALDSLDEASEACEVVDHRIVGQTNAVSEDEFSCIMRLDEAPHDTLSKLGASARASLMRLAQDHELSAHASFLAASYAESLLVCGADLNEGTLACCALIALKLDASNSTWNRGEPHYIFFDDSIKAAARRAKMGHSTFCALECHTLRALEWRLHRSTPCDYINVLAVREHSCGRLHEYGAETTWKTLAEELIGAAMRWGFAKGELSHGAMLAAVCLASARRERGLAEWSLRHLEMTGIGGPTVVAALNRLITRASCCYI